jgi:zinc transport system substrate-binding protein
MNKLAVLLSALLLSSFFGVSLLPGCTPGDTSRLKVITSTSLLTYIVEQVGGERVEALNIVPSTSHPGDFDARPGDIQKLAEARLFLVHGWPGEQFVPDLIAAADNPDLTVITVAIEGNWMTPPVQLRAAEEVAAALSQVDSRNKPTYQSAAAQYQERVVAKEAEIRVRLAEANLSQINVMCAFWQAGFVGWTGLKVVATYGEPDSLTPRAVQELVDKGREERVTLIIDNLHSGPDAGKGIAEELGSDRVILSNFPGGLADTETWEQAIDHNVTLLLAAIAE